MAQTALTSSKRKAETAPTESTKRTRVSAKTDGNAKQCISCGCESDGEKRLVFPQISDNCHKAHRNDVCKLCWDQYIAIKVLDDGLELIPCVHDKCGAFITYADLKRITSRKILDHYDWQIRRKEAQRSGKRECFGDWKADGSDQKCCFNIQKHELNVDGRVFACNKCGNQECVLCGVREHKGETCAEFQYRLKVQHGEREAATADALKNGYWGMEIVGKPESGVRKLKWKKPMLCARCGTCWELAEKCKHVKCETCANQFCIGCEAPYFGANSVPALGNAAHKEGCVYWGREKEDRRFKHPDKPSKGAKGGAKVDVDNQSEVEGDEKAGFGNV